ncbi:MAG: hypothetical protein M0Z38_06855 [Deltaproteobacteria bacterium]|nr:hypothetical protein [Deltaproteobacteria bacterium]
MSDQISLNFAEKTEPDPRDFETPTEAAAWDVYNCGKPPKAIAAALGMSINLLSMKLSGAANLFANELDLIRNATGGKMIAKYFAVRDLVPKQAQRELTIQRLEKQVTEIAKTLMELRRK